MIREAAEFAERAHRGTFRKGSNIPYIYHPMEVALLTARMTDDEEVIAAAYLHDVLEDTKVTAQEVQEAFGPGVLRLVAAETEDKSLSWNQRKSATIHHLLGAAYEVKILTLADKLSNIRTTARDYLVIGDEVWNRFNETQKTSHQWYFCGILEALKELEEEPAYRELKDLYEMIFGA